MVLPTFSYIEECLQYNPNGILTWKRKPRTHFMTATKWNTWNNNSALKDAGKCNISGILRINLKEVAHYANKIVWKLHKDSEPDRLYSINGQLADIRIENLTPDRDICEKIKVYIPGTDLHLEVEDSIYNIMANNLIIRRHSNLDQALQTGRHFAEKIGLQFNEELK